MGDYYIVGLTLNWDIKAILCCGFHFSTPDVPYKIKPYKHTYQPRTLPFGCIVSRISFHLAASPQWNGHCERLCYSWVCVVIFLPEWVPFCPWLTFSFFFSSFCFPLCRYQPSLFCLPLFFQISESYSEKMQPTECAHPAAQRCLMGCAPWKNSLQTWRPPLSSFTPANNKRRAFFPFKFFLSEVVFRQWTKRLSADLDSRKKNQPNEWW